jgi:hypothetical protein
MRLRDLSLPSLLLLLAALGVLAYLPSLTLPLVSDDYTQIWLGRQYGPPSGWSELARDPLYRCRATSIWMTYWTERLFGASAPVLNASSLVLHVLNTWLVFALGAWRAVGWRVAALAAAFFAVHEGHQEAVMWYAALPELLVFFFAVLALLAWILWVQSAAARFRLYAASLILFALALLSKESAVALVPLLVLPAWTGRLPWKKTVLSLAPFAGFAAVYVTLAFSGSDDHQHFRDGTFSLSAPVWMTLPNSALRLFWIWGVASLLYLGIRRAKEWTRLLTLAGCWVGVTLLPYSFLTYMPRVPSRHLYLASAGLALVVAAGFLAFHERRRPARRWAVATLAAVIVLHNCLYLWTKKRDQYVRRAAPVEALIDFSRKTEGRIHVKCFHYGEVIARHAVEIGAGKPPSMLVWDPLASPQDEPVFCDETQP